jgi:TPR repeat protein
MAHDVFISYSSKDKTTGDAVCAMLESEGVRCWIAPRDVTPSMEWSECIIDAIQECRIMVLVFTTSANESPQIHREIERAVNHGVAVLPFRTEDILPDKALEYFIGNVHWLDALTTPMEVHLKNLAETVKMLLARMPSLETTAAATPSPAQVAAALKPDLAGAGFTEKREAARTAAFAATTERASENQRSVVDTGAVGRQQAQKRPGGVTAFAVVAFAIAAVALISVFGGGGASDAFPLVIVAGIAGAAGYGLFKMKAWGRIVGIIFAVLICVALGILAATIGSGDCVTYVSGGAAVKCSAGGVFWSAWSGGLALCGFALWYLFTAGVKQAFGGQAKTASAYDSTPVPAAGAGKFPARSKLLGAAIAGAFVIIVVMYFLMRNTGSPQSQTGSTPAGNAGGQSSQNAEAKDWTKENLDAVEAAAKSGVTEAQYELGRRYYFGLEGANKDYEKAFGWFQMAADHGDARAQNKIGYMFSAGRGVPKDDVKAVDWFRKGAEQGNMDAQFNLGVQYQEGIGVPRDYVEAADWFRKAAEQDFDEAQSNLAFMYENGRGVPKDYAQAMSWYRKAADQDYAEAQYNIGYMYEKGLGVSRDVSEARSWYQKAADQGYADASARLANLGK